MKHAVFSAFSLASLLASNVVHVSSKSCVKDHFPHSLDVPVDVYEGLNSCLDGSSPDFKCSTNINGGNTELNLGGCGLVDADAGDINECISSVGRSTIMALMLQMNGLTMIFTDWFVDLDSLESLSLDQNDFTQLPVDVFNSLTQLEALSLNSNNLSTLPAGIFSGGVGSEAGFPLSISLAGIPFSEVPGRLFDGARLAELNWGGANLNELPEDLFAGVLSLELLTLDANGLTTLPEDVFAGLSGLRFLELIDNDLMTLPDGVFSGLSLTQLDLRGNDNLGCLPAIDPATEVILPDNYDEEEACATGSTCDTGFPGVQRGNICCSEECGTCGGKGCAKRPGGSSECCIRAIAESGIFCRASLAAPCIDDSESAGLQDLLVVHQFTALLFLVGHGLKFAFEQDGGPVSDDTAHQHG